MNSLACETQSKIEKWFSIFCRLFWLVHFNKMMLWFWLPVNFLISRIIHIETTNEACHGEYSVSGMFLKGHTFKTISVDSPTRYQILCSQDVRCQSYNFIIGKHICELNNRTKEARPHIKTSKTINGDST